MKIGKWHIKVGKCKPIVPKVRHQRIPIKKFPWIWVFWKKYYLEICVYSYYLEGGRKMDYVEKPNLVLLEYRKYKNKMRI